MKVTAVLANHAEAQNNLLYVAGAGIDRSVIPAGLPAPWSVSLAVAILVMVPWTQTNQQHTLDIALIDADGHAVQIPTGPDTFAPFTAQMAFNVGRPPLLEVGEDQTVALAVNVPMLPLSVLGQYRFVVSIDGTPMEELPFRLVNPPGMTIGSGPTALPQA